MGLIYSTNKNLSFDQGKQESQTRAPQHQLLEVKLEKKGRGGKTAIIIAGFVGTTDDLKTLSKYLKTQCGVGGSEKDGEIIIQGDVREKVMTLLQAKGYKVKRVGG